MTFSGTIKQWEEWSELQIIELGKYIIKSSKN
jgi:hypothetical protein